MAVEKDKIVLKDDQGEEKEFYKLIQFYSNETNKRYLVYTDQEKDNNEKLKLYSSIIVGEGDNIEFIPVSEEKDQDVVNQAVIQTKLEFM